MGQRRIATEQDIPGMETRGLTTLNFGGGLQLRIHTKGYKYFQFRFRLDGRDRTVQLGRYPAMTLAQAEEKAAPFRMKVMDLRVDKTEAAFQRCIAPSSRQTVDSGPFRNIEDARLFLQRLDRSEDRGEVERALWLQIHLRLRSSELRLLQWSQFDRGREVWTPSTGALAVVHLSTATIARLTAMHSQDGSGYLFPGLAAQTTQASVRALNAGLAKHWPEYAVDIDAISRFFQVTAERRSYFRAELIRDTVTRRARSRRYEDEAGYVIQRKAIAEWWSAQVSSPFGNF